MKFFSIPITHKHGYKLIRPGKFKIPTEIEVPVFLIRQELMLRMLFNSFSAIGFNECYFEPHLDRLILASLRMWDGTDETNNIYIKIMDKWSSNINPNPDVITRRALKIYHALILARERKHQLTKQKGLK